jgi:hypothetical protein
MVSIGLWRSATQDLTHAGLVLSPQRARGRWLVRLVLTASALALGAGAGYVARGRMPGFEPQAAGPTPETLLQRQQLEQTRLALRLSDARASELERQIDSLNQRLRESQDELAFFRKAGAAKH